VAWRPVHGIARGTVHGIAPPGEAARLCGLCVGEALELRLHVAVVPGEQLRLRDEAVAMRVELEEDRLHLGPARVDMHMHMHIGSELCMHI
jgi:hypothetical protein